ncbi:MAG: group 1 glycosyl transferase, partial [Cyanobacteria bacterium J06649_11]
MRKLLILPGSCEGLGGTLVSLSMLLEGCKIHQMEERLCVLVRSDSPMEKYLRKFGQDYCLQVIPALSQVEFFKQAIQWVSKQPKHYPLLLDNCAYNYLLPTFLMLAPKLRLSGRSVYYFCHDLTRSNKVLGYVARKLIFSCLSPRAICNSSFTADNVRNLMPNIKGILYQVGKE